MQIYQNIEQVINDQVPLELEIKPNAEASIEVAKMATPPDKARIGSDRQTPLFTNKKIVDVGIENSDERAQARSSNGDNNTADDQFILRQSQLEGTNSKGAEPRGGRVVPASTRAPAATRYSKSQFRITRKVARRASDVSRVNNLS